MFKTSTLTLIVTDLRIAQAQSRDSQLARLAARGTVQRIWDCSDPDSAALLAWEYGLLRALGLHADRALWASAPVSCAAFEPAGCSGFWMHAEPVHFVAGLDTLSFARLRVDAAVTEDERGALRSMIAEHLQTYDMSLHELPRGLWMIHTADALDVATASPDAAAQTALEEAMPRGRDAGALRRLMTELQMLLHDHPVNAQRVRHDLPAINAVWMWGGGTSRRAAVKKLPALYGDEPYLQGLCRLHSHRCFDLPADAAALARDARRTDAVVVLDARDFHSLEEDWLAPLVRSLRGGAWARLDLIVDGWLVSATRRSLWRFWRGAHPPSRWTA